MILTKSTKSDKTADGHLGFGAFMPNLRSLSSPSQQISTNNSISEFGMRFVIALFGWGCAIIKDQWKANRFEHNKVTLAEMAEKETQPVGQSPNGDSKDLGQPLLSKLGPQRLWKS